MLNVKDISCNYGEIKVLENIDFGTNRGECIGIIGPNGSGKSTLLKAISKIIKPASGNIILCEKDISKMSSKDLAKNLAVVPQDTNVDFEFSCLDIVLMGRNPHIKRFGMESKKDYDVAYTCMEQTGTLHLKDRLISELSGGERQRVIIARALAQEPGVLLLDEPVSHLDINHQIEVLELIERLKKNNGLEVIMVIHDLNLAARYCDRLILLHENKILCAGRPEDVLTRDNIRKAFCANVLVRRHPLTGFVYITLLNSNEPKEKVSGKKVHLISGAGTGTQIMYSLLSKGYDVSAGVLNVLDSDYEAAMQLNIKTVIEAPFSPITPEAYAQNIEMMKNADVIVVSDVPVGWGNLKNLEAVSEIAGSKPVIMVEDEISTEKDFTNGEASKIREKIMSAGAVIAHGAGELPDIIKNKLDA
ncbi:heme ABC transporter ATP-binding protein [Methanocella sp. CWC-04]|uniref:Cobalamin import ATP-binding protein BtuD n=1 Tax=Methanooceanicella nereidis TaxID=2052831 RepID=A0AAP2RCE5_9EURY|nr:heme ABC transporter ATP-binding protein [Methanocella sp. CWC-04]